MFPFRFPALLASVALVLCIREYCTTSQNHGSFAADVGGCTHDGAAAVCTIMSILLFSAVFSTSAISTQSHNSCMATRNHSIYILFFFIVRVCTVLFHAHLAFKKIHKKPCTDCERNDAKSLEYLDLLYPGFLINRVGAIGVRTASGQRFRYIDCVESQYSKHRKTVLVHSASKFKISLLYMHQTNKSLLDFARRFTFPHAVKQAGNAHRPP